MVITLTTDFGHKDPFAGVMKGVVLSINPQVRIVDLTHEIPPQDIKEAAYVLWDSFPYFPSGSVHVVVVDPEVGSERRAIIINSHGQFFIGPDNGVFTKIIPEAKEIRRLTPLLSPLNLRGGSQRGATFHGRDVFAPAAAWLSKGKKPSAFGPAVKDPVTLSLPEPLIKKGRLYGEVVRFDRFGNAITNISDKDLSFLMGKRPIVKIKRLALPIAAYYAQAGEMKAGAIINSNGWLEIFSYLGSAKDILRLVKGTPVEVHAG